MADAFIFRSVTVGLMPGIPVQRQFTVPDLQDGVTVVHGPNGVGKSTLARAMELLLWKEGAAGERVILDGRAEVAGRTQFRERSQGQLSARTEDGGAADPALPGQGFEARNRYRISLRDLLQEGDPNEEFGALLQREMLGGVDLVRLRDQVRAKNRFSANLGTPQVREARAAKDAVEAELRRQRAKENLELEIQSLEDELAAEPRLGAELKALEHRLESLAKAGELLDLEAALEPFAGEEPRLRLLNETSAETFRKDSADRDKAAGDLDTAGKLCREAKDAYRALGLAREPRVADPVEARRLAEALAEARKARDGAEAGLIEARALLDGHTRFQAWLGEPGPGGPRLTEADLAQAGDLAGDLEASLATLKAWGRIGEQLEDPAPAPAATSCDQGLTLLAEWLGAEAKVRAVRQAPGRTGLLAAALALALGAAAAGAWLGGPVWGLPGLGAALLLALALFRRPLAGLEAERDGLQGRLRELGLELPEPLTQDAALNLRAALLRLQGEQVRHAQLKALRTLAAKLKDDEEKHFQARQTAARDLPGLGALPLQRRPGFLALVARALEEARTRWADVNVAEAQAKVAGDRLTKLQEETAAFVAGFHPGADGGLDSTLEVLRADLDQGLLLLARIQRLEEALATAASTAKAAADRVQTLLDAVGGLPAADYEALLNRWEAWDAAATRQREARRFFQEHLATRHGAWTFIEDRLLAPDGPLAGRRALLEETRKETQAELGRFREALGAMGDRRTERGSKQAELEAFLQRGDLARAIRAKEQAIRDLEALRLSELALQVHDLVLSSQASLAEAQDFPEVLRRASELFAQFSGRYTLHFNAEDGFHAQDGGARLGLDELSDGSRVQLLVAVRLAYVEKDEAVQLPIFLDEVLANTDDARATAIIQAVLKLAERGRQIFYFTAQGDELEKWRRLGGDRVHEVDLRAIREQASSSYLAIPAERWRPRTIPVPPGLDLQAFAGTLGAAAPSLWTPLDEQHPWHVLGEGDQGLLAELLEHRVETVRHAQLWTAYREDETGRRLLATIQALGAAQEWLQENRPRPLTADAIRAAAIPGLGDGMKTKLIQVLQDVAGDAPALLATPPKGLGPVGIAALKTWLEKEGHLRPEPRPVVECLMELRARFGERLPRTSRGWEAVERFLDLAR